ncbi:choice-of-anchor M domain-containing protein [Conexibacter sp. JD483]|uniref:choice-of-anchor M domain-containing protein n=1 Tax=unclassified Conexibacter TaxID=2627773 RepID=UPI00271710DF|nr:MULTISPECIES: choice-of-anchor M domain-containing protein [unclassified Conexibacter]MDO8183971.1 choice-of-anchor M domain-containing protein [Conexibacter sp. CPCC 205706]MDO8196963.1 choice-of-anchor M domain-containing protein [Conexibacter sp. CPCC 205762]MDR9369067.1 choice-of-anchor M domain-containing protein [Conexibacter sp. JD483]
MIRRAGLLAGLATAALGVAVAPAVAAGARPAQVTVLTSGHTDLGPRMVDGRLRLQARYEQSSSGVYDWYDVDDTIFVFSADSRVRALPGDNSRAAWGDPGDSVWWLPISSTFNRLWPGFSLAAASDADFSREFTLTIDSVTGPGDVVIDDGAGMRHGFLSTRVGVPTAMGFGASAYGHFHTHWVVTKPGVYCLNLRLDGRALDGTWLRDTQQLTLATEGSADLQTLVPCAEDPAKRAPAQVVSMPQPAAQGGTPVVIATDANVRLQPQLQGGELRVPLVETQTAYREPSRRPRDVVLYGASGVTASAARPWEGPAGATVPGLAGTLGWGTARLDPARAPGGAQVELAGVTAPGGGPAPGTLTISNPVSGWGGVRLSTDPRFAVSSYDVGHDETRTLNVTATAPGVYCATLRWTATVDGTITHAPAQTLTLALDDPAAPRLDPAAIEPCERRAEPEPPAVLEAGHVDLASRLVGGELELSVADQTAGDGSTTFRDLAGVVLAAGAASRVTVPDGYGFLAGAGTTAWVLPGAQQDAADRHLLWPGWSTDRLPRGRTTGDVSWTLRDVRGPGHIVVWTADGLDARPEILFSTRRAALPQTIPIPQETHAHGNWGFTAAGVYCLDLDIAVKRADGAALHDTRTAVFAVDQTDPGTASSADCAGRPQPDRPPADDGGDLQPDPTPPGAPLPPGDGSQPAPPPPTAGTAPAPRLRVTGLRAPKQLTLRRFVRAGLAVRVTPPGTGAKLRATLTATPAVARQLRLRRHGAVATVTETARGRRTLTLRLRPSKPLRTRLSRLARRGVVTLRLRVAITAADGRTAATTTSIRLRLP